MPPFLGRSHPGNAVGKIGVVKALSPYVGLAQFRGSSALYVKLRGSTSALLSFVMLVAGISVSACVTAFPAWAKPYLPVAMPVNADIRQPMITYLHYLNLIFRMMTRKIL